MAFPVDHPTPSRPVIELMGGSRLVARARPWSMDPDVALLTVVDPRPVALAVDVPSWLTRLAGAGYRRVRTSALSAEAAAVLERFGFEVIQRLAILSLGPVALSRGVAPPGPTNTNWPVRALRWRTDALRPRREVHRALVIDRDAFGDSWCLDHQGWRDAVRATPQHRVTVVEHDGEVIGFALCGATREDGFLQRLAVDPRHHRHGVGRALVNDTIAWMGRHARRQLFVNTDCDNQPALGLYLSLGFQQRTEELMVLHGPTAPGTTGLR